MKYHIFIRVSGNLIWTKSHLWPVPEFLFNILGSNYGLIKNIEPEFGQTFRHDHN
jgi:hypothetical protein